MTRLAVAALLLVGCAAPSVDVTGPQSEAPGAKRWTAGASRHAPVKVRARHRRPTSRNLSRRPVARRLTVTAYCYTGSRNAAGKWPTAGTAAANAYPLGTRLHVAGIGDVIVEDRSAPGATDVDIYMGDQADCATRAAAFGRRVLLVSEVAA